MTLIVMICYHLNHISQLHEYKSKHVGNLEIWISIRDS